MRILAGEARGRVLKTREGKGTRPTDARAREMLFNILSTRIVGMRVLDLYAGSGAVGLEALSRGAASCLFIEQNAAAAAAIRANIRACGYQERTQVWHTSVRSALHRLSEEWQKFGETRGEGETLPVFDLIFADPPFSRPEELTMLCRQLERALDNAPQLLHNAPMLYFAGGDASGEDASDENRPDGVAVVDAVGTSRANRSGLLIIQHHRKVSPLAPETWKLWQERRAGESVLSFFHVTPGVKSREAAADS